MIGAAALPKAALPSPASPHDAHAAPISHSDADHAAPADDAGREDAPPRADRAPSDDPRASRARNVSQARRNARRDRGVEADDASPARDAFARLLDTTPADSTKPVVPTVATTATKVDDADDTATSTPTHALPDQLLGLLASLAPAAQAAPPQAPATPAGTPLSTQAAAEAAPRIATAARPVTPPLGADAAGALLPTLQASEGTAAAVAATPAFAAALEAEKTGTPLPSLHDASRSDTPAPTPFDALLRAPAVTAADVPRPILPATPTPVAQPTDPRAGYGDELGTSVVWMADQRISHAEVRVVPEHLGPIDVRLQLDGAQVHATFLSAQPEVRHALEASLPRLRELLGQQGLDLAQADVGQRQPDPRATRGGQQATGDGRESGDNGFAPSSQTDSRVRVVRGLLDEYA